MEALSTQQLYNNYNEDQLSKIGNTIIYLIDNVKSISKTKILKILYILDEVSIKKTGIPFLNLNYEVWKFGPVDRDLFVELSSRPSLLKDFIRSEESQLVASKKFCDDEFTQNDLELLDYVIDEFGSKTTPQLIKYTHRANSPWHKLAVKHDILEKLENEEISSTEINIDMSELIDYDSRKKQIYINYLAYSK